VHTNRILVYGAAIAGLALVLTVAGVRLAALIPFAVLLVCPLMMFFMMRGMAGMHGADAEDHTGHGCERDPTRTAEPPASRPS
jgi:hypothetical protein